MPCRNHPSGTSQCPDARACWIHSSSSWHTPSYVTHLSHFQQSENLVPPDAPVTQPITYSPVRPDILLLFTHLFNAKQPPHPTIRIPLVIGPCEDDASLRLGGSGGSRTRKHFQQSEDLVPTDALVTQPITCSPVRPDVLPLFTHLFNIEQLPCPATVVASEVVMETLVIDPDEDHESLRFKARREGDRMSECLQQATNAYARNGKRLARELSLKGEAHKENTGTSQCPIEQAWYIPSGRTTMTLVDRPLKHKTYLRVLTASSPDIIVHDPKTRTN
ncbi:hypothetical protein K503DRAFT_786158 [Rhizopogon vinicolor AM-OR11-026]|uniref:DUF1771 domain-containing protein n=1 Tax=Rhizopogon vinicolor AM-OR11-026 TaxID=1314800 RepID=A0A1B7MMU2_9AGAM|nr:hypothetical protein K503DRAFT_786158 [Rhizopogon vinicolor AM-OR11-026]